MGYVTTLRNDGKGELLGRVEVPDDAARLKLVCRAEALGVDDSLKSVHLLERHHGREKLEAPENGSKYCNSKRYVCRRRSGAVW